MPDRSHAELEALLRSGLHAEADASLIEVDPAIVRTRWQARQGQAQRRSRLLAAAAVVVLAVGGGLLLVRGLGLTVPVASTPTPSAVLPEPSRALPPLAPAAGTVVIDEAGEPSTSTGPAVTPLGSVTEVGWYDIAVACLGPGQLTFDSPNMVLTEGSNETMAPVPCDGVVAARGFGLTSPMEAQLTVTVDGATAWHVIVVHAPLSPAIRDPLGAADPDTAVLIRQGGDDSLVVVGVSMDSTETPLATIPRSAMPDGTIELRVFPPQVSELGWLAVPIVTDPGGDSGIVAIVDLYDPSGTTMVVDDVAGLGARELVWGPGGRLVVQSRTGPMYADPATGTTVSISLADGVELRGAGGMVSADRYVWTLDGTGLLATRASGDTVEPGWVSLLDGTFTAGTPATYQATGMGRATGIDGSTLGQACDDGPTQSSSGCFVATFSTDGTRIATWYPASLGAPAALDAAWASDGTGVLMLLPPDHGKLPIAHFDAPDRHTVLSSLDGPKGLIVGLSGDDHRLALYTGDGRTSLVETDSGQRLDSDGVFAGWEAPSTYPAAAR